MSDLQAEPSTRSIWSGRISIGLVNVPVKLYTMIKDQSFSFKLVRKEDACPLRYERVCTLDNKVVPWSEVGRAVEVQKGEYVVFSDKELDNLRPESNKKIAINKFVPMNQVDRVFYDTSYILSPDKSDDSYGLLLKAFKEKELAGVGKFTLRTKEYPVVIYPYHDALVLTTLRYSDEVVDPKSIKEVMQAKVPSKEELELALKIIDNLRGDFNIKDFKDTFRDEVQKLVDSKMKGETITVEKPQAEEVRGLMQALRDTLTQMQ
jgi:DNA end-binding protein Ku